MWIWDPSSFFTAANAWAMQVVGNPVWVLLKKLEYVKKALHHWNRVHFGFIKDCLRALTCALDNVQQSAPTVVNLALKSSIKCDIHEQLIGEQLLWKQRSRVEWLVSKDLNTKFFHMSTVVCRNWNSIITLQGEDNSWLAGRKAIGDSLVNRIGQLFGSSNPSIPLDLANHISLVISSEDWSLLDTIPTGDEILLTIKSMGSTKAPGPDGLPILFFKKYWGIIFELIATV